MQRERGSPELGVKVMNIVTRVSVQKAQQQVHSSPHAWQNGVFRKPYTFVKRHETQFLWHTSFTLARRSQWCV